MTINEKNNNEANPEQESWLQRLKQESWEAELLVSAVAIFGTFQMFEIAKWATYRFIDLLAVEQYLIGYGLAFLGYLAFTALAVLFVVHFVIRAYWVGLVGLNSVFGDYGHKDSAFSPYYVDRMSHLLPKLSSTIKSIDELASVLFSVAFSLLFLYSYIAILLTACLFIFNALSAFIPTWILVIPLILMVLLTTAQAIFSALAMREKFYEHEFIQKLNFTLVVLNNKILLGPLYKNILQVVMIFGSNYKQKKSMILVLILLVLLSLGFSLKHVTNDENYIPYLIKSKTFFDTRESYAGYYAINNSEVNFLIAPEIQTDVVNDRVIKLFVPVFFHERNLNTAACKALKTKEPAKKLSSKQKKQARLTCLQSYHSIQISDTTIQPEINWIYHANTQQRGFLTYLDLKEFESGLHTITITKRYSESFTRKYEIDFYYDPSID